MTQSEFNKRARALFIQHENLLSRKNPRSANGNGIFDRYANPVLTAEHTP